MDGGFLSTPSQAQIDKMNDRIAIAEKTIDALEQQLATMVVGMFEQGIMIEAVSEILIKSASNEHLEEFKQLIKTKRSAMLKAMEEGASVLSGDG